MDILTPRGQETVEQEKEAAGLFCAAFPQFTYVNTPKNEPCVFDAFLVEGDTISAAVECKCRQMTYEQFTGQFESKWLITAAKLEDSAAVLNELRVPLVGFLYLVPSKTLLTRRLFDPITGMFAPMEMMETRTQATVNGGVAWRRNAYVDMRDAKVIKAPEQEAPPKSP